MHHDYERMRLGTGAVGVRRFTLVAWNEVEARILGRLAEQLIRSPDPMQDAVAKLLPLETGGVEELADK